MPRSSPSHRSLWRILGSLVIGASVAVLSPTAAFGQRPDVPDSPYAFYPDDPTDSFDPPFTDVGSTTVDPGVDAGLPVAQTAGDPGPASSLGPDVLPNDVTPGVPDGTENPVQPGGLARTGLELLQRVAFALLLVGAGLVVLKMSRRRRVWSR